MFQHLAFAFQLCVFVGFGVEFLKLGVLVTQKLLVFPVAVGCLACVSQFLLGITPGMICFLVLFQG